MSEVRKLGEAGRRRRGTNRATFGGDQHISVSRRCTCPDVYERGGEGHEKGCPAHFCATPGCTKKRRRSLSRSIEGGGTQRWNSYSYNGIYCGACEKRRKRSLQATGALDPENLLLSRGGKQAAYSWEINNSMGKVSPLYEIGFEDGWYGRHPRNIDARDYLLGFEHGVEGKELHEQYQAQKHAAWQKTSVLLRRA